ncbi:MAG: hypothetical protein WD942_01080 [Dehalococcoidia bacterium]
MLFFLFLVVGPALNLAAVLMGEAALLSVPAIQSLVAVSGVVEIVSFLALLGAAVTRSDPFAVVAAVLVLTLAVWSAEIGPFTSLWMSIMAFAIAFDTVILEAMDPAGPDPFARFFR